MVDEHDNDSPLFIRDPKRVTDTQGNLIERRYPAHSYGGGRTVWHVWGPRAYQPEPGLVELPTEPGYWMMPHEFEARYGYRHPSLEDRS